MTRVHGHHAQPGASGIIGSVHHKRVEPKKKPSYKVVLEEVTGKKKLNTLLSLREDPPRGYMFIPAGDPQLTNRCKKIAKDQQLTVFIVSTSKNPQEKMSREVHRIGYHFPSIVVDQACMTLGVTLTASGRVLQSNFAFINDQVTGQQQAGRGLMKKLKGRRRNAYPSLDMNLSQAVIDTQAREAIKDLFPKIPADDLHTIIGRAFQKGKGLVGTSELSLVRRAQLAVTAHIRHEYTNYDRFLKSMKWAEARKQVEQACLDVLVQWRGDDDDDGELEDILREVIVISDDEDTDDDIPRDAKTVQEDRERSKSVEFVSADTLHTQTVDYAAAKSVAGQDRSPSMDIDAHGIVYQGSASLIQNRPIQYDQRRLKQMGAHRHKIWEEAVSRQRKHPNTVFAGDLRPPSPTFELINRDRHQLPLPGTRDVEQHPYGAKRLEPSQYSIRADGSLVPVPATMNQITHNVADGVESLSKSTEQVCLPPHIQQPAPQRIREQPARSQYLEGPESQQYVSRSLDNRIRPVEYRVENTRFVKHAKTGSDIHYVSNSSSVEDTSRHHSNTVLPSVEGDIFRTRDENFSYSNPFQKTDKQSREGRDLLLPSPVFVIGNEDQPHTKRRKVNEQQVLEEEQIRMSRLLVNRGEGLSQRESRPAQAASDKGMPPFLLDERIIPLPPKGTRSYRDGGGHSPSLPQRGQVDNPSVLHEPWGQSETCHIIPEVAGQSQSLRRSAAFPTLNDRKSHALSYGSAPSHHGIPNFLASPHHASSTVIGEGQVYSGSQVIRQKSQQIGQVQKDIGNLAIAPSLRSRQDVSMRAEMQNERDLYERPKSQSIVYLPERAKEGSPWNEVGERRRQSVGEEPTVSRCMQQRMSNNIDPGRSHQDVTIYGKYGPRQSNQEGVGNSSQRSSRLLIGRCDLSVLELTTHMMYQSDSYSRAPETQTWAVPYNMDSNDRFLRNQANTNQWGDGESRPITRICRGPRHDRGRVTGEVVVLE